MKKLFLYFLIITLFICFTSCNKCNNSQNKPYKYIIRSEYIRPDGWEATTEEIIYLENGSVKYYDDYLGWVTLSEFTIREFHCTE